MARPRTPIGTFGEIYFETASRGRARAFARFRDHDGQLGRVQATTETPKAAERKRGNGLTRQDKTAPKFPDLLRRDFTADRPNARWVGDMTEIPNGVDGRGPKLYLATASLR